MFKKGVKVSPDRTWKGENYPQLTAEEYTVKYSYMTNTYTWVVLRELPDQVFNVMAFGNNIYDGPCFAVKTTRGGFLLSDLEILQEMNLLDTILGFKELQNITESLEYFSTCAICERIIKADEKPGVLSTADLAMLRVCPACCQRTPQLKVNFPNQPTYNDLCIDWWEELGAYGEMIGQLNLREEIQKAIDEKCDQCEKADSHEDCSPGICPYYLIEDYLALYRKDIFNKLKTWAEEKLRHAYPDPNEQ